MSKLKVLFFGADPQSVLGGKLRLELDREAREIEEEVIAAVHRDNVDFRTCWATRIRDLQRGLNRVQPDVVHFSGHGGEDGLVLVASGGWGSHHVGAEALKEFFEAHRGQIRLVVLNACHSQEQAKAIAEAVGCAIGTPSAISDDAAIAFGAAFYSSIACDNSVQTAFDQARATLHMENIPQGQWPVLEARDDVDPSQLYLTRPDEVRRRPRWIAVAATAIVLSGTALYYACRPDPACAPARQLLREVRKAGVPAQAPVTLLEAPAASVDPNDPMAPPELVKANQLHASGDHDADFLLFRKLAEAGNAQAMTSLGLAYLHGEGTPVLPDSAVKWLREAASKGDPRGMTELGNAYLRRQGVDRNLDYEAKNWYEKAAEARYPEAMRNLGNLYRQGRGVERPDSALAMDWYERAAKAGFIDAMVDIGWMFEKGLAVSPNQRQATCWYEAAAKAGSARGRAAIGQVDESARPSGDTLE